MTRKKVKLAYITNDAARKATFKKRKKGLMKKVSELSTLCGIDACAIIYSPYDSEPEIWPSQLGVQRVISEFKKMSEMEQSRKMVNQEGFLRQRITKGEEQLKKQQRDNREKEMMQVMTQSLIGEGMQNLGIVDLNDLGWLADKTIKEIDEKIKSLDKIPPPKQNYDEGGNGKHNVIDHTGMDSMQNQQWFMDFMKPNNESLNHGRHQEAMAMPPYGYNTNHGNGNGSGSWANFLFP